MIIDNWSRNQTLPNWNAGSGTSSLRSECFCFYRWYLQGKFGKGCIACIVTAWLSCMLLDLNGFTIESLYSLNPHLLHFRFTVENYDTMIFRCVPLLEAIEPMFCIVILLVLCCRWAYWNLRNLEFPQRNDRNGTAYYLWTHFFIRLSLALLCIGLR
jgi:hypothetical protein